MTDEQRRAHLQSLVQQRHGAKNQGPAPVEKKKEEPKKSGSNIQLITFTGGSQSKPPEPPITKKKEQAALKAPKVQAPGPKAAATETKPADPLRNLKTIPGKTPVNRAPPQEEIKTDIPPVQEIDTKEIKSKEEKKSKIPEKKRSVSRKRSASRKRSPEKTDKKEKEVPVSRKRSASPKRGREEVVDTNTNKRGRVDEKHKQESLQTAPPEKEKRARDEKEQPSSKRARDEKEEPPRKKEKKLELTEEQKEELEEQKRVASVRKEHEEKVSVMKQRQEKEMRDMELTEKKRDMEHENFCKNFDEEYDDLLQRVLALYPEEERPFVFTDESRQEAEEICSDDIRFENEMKRLEDILKNL